MTFHMFQFSDTFLHQDNSIYATIGLRNFIQER